MIFQNMSKTEQEGKPWYASKWSEEKWAEKKKMMEAFEETGMKNLFKDMMTEDFMEDLGESENYINFYQFYWIK